MKREDIVGILPIFFIYLYFYLIQVYITNPQLQQALGLAGIFLLVGLLVMQEAWVKIRYAGYKLLKGYILGAKEEYQWLIDKVLEAKVPGKEGRSAVKLILARPWRHREYGGINEVILDMPKAMFESLDFTPLKYALSIYGMDVDHPSVAYAILKEENDVKVDHAKPIPVYKVIVTDKYEGDMEETSLLEKTGEIVKGNVKVLVDKIKALMEELERTKRLLNEKHKQLIRCEEQNAGLRSEAEALLRSTLDVVKMAYEMVFYIREQYGNLFTAAEHISRGGLKDKLLSREAWITIGILGLAGLLLWRKDLLFWLVSHPWHTLIIAVSLAIVSYYTFKGLRGR